MVMRLTNKEIAKFSTKDFSIYFRSKLTYVTKRAAALTCFLSDIDFIIKKDTFSLDFEISENWVQFY